MRDRKISKILCDKMSIRHKIYTNSIGMLKTKVIFDVLQMECLKMHRANAKKSDRKIFDFASKTNDHDHHVIMITAFRHKQNNWPSIE